MVSKVIICLLVLCCVSLTVQAPDHNRTRRADDKPAIPSVPFSIADFQGFMNVISNWIPGQQDKDKEPEKKE